MFGKKIYFEDGGGSNSKEAPAPAPSDAATVPPAKRGKGAVHGGQPPPRCQVVGCEADLTGAKTYYCRHKVCAMHSKAPKVIVAGLEQRFCQQCSRFHQLPEFDQGKRSCRRRLAGHNERRRKPPTVPSASRFARHSSSFQEEPGRLRSFLVDFSCPRILSAPRDVWPTIHPVDPGATNQYLGILYPPCNAAVLHGVHPCMQGHSEWPVYSLPERSPSDCLAGASDSSCALSLLSTQPWNNNTRNRVSTMMSPNINGTSMAHPTITNNSIPNSWSCISHRGKTSSQNIQHDIRLAGAAEVGDGQSSGELELAPQGNGQSIDCGCSSRAAMHWSL